MNPLDPNDLTNKEVNKTIKNKTMKTKFRYTVRECLIKNITHESCDFHNMISMLKETTEKSWKPKARESYYMIDSIGQISSQNWDNDSFDKYRLSIGNCFPYTEEGKKQAWEYIEKLKNSKEK